MNGWSINVILQFVCMNVSGPTRETLVGCVFHDWTTFKLHTTVRTAVSSDREDEMKARKQTSSESIMNYVQPKLRMCRFLGLSFELTKDHVLRGLLCRERMNSPHGMDDNPKQTHLKQAQIMMGRGDSLRQVQKNKDTAQIEATN